MNACELFTIRCKLLYTIYGKILYIAANYSNTTTKKWPVDFFCPKLAKRYLAKIYHTSVWFLGRLSKQFHHLVNYKWFLQKVE